MKLERPLEPERPVEIANVEDFDRECTQIEAAARRDGRLYGLTLSSDQALLTIVVGGEVSMVEWMGLGTDGVMREVKHARSTV
ncbi:MAG TPA: hypothetical protein VF221_03390, partial [Chloroflexota bacterium]